MASFDEDQELYTYNWNRSFFATSEARDEAGPSAIRHHNPSICEHVCSTRITPSATRPSMTTFREKWHGIYTDGNQLKYTADAPEVQMYLNEARDTLELPPIDCHFVYTLAAMAVHNKPTDPAHWILWSDAQYAKTIEIIQSVSRASNELFFSSDQWTLEKQRRIKNLYQTPKFYDEATLKSLPWYTILVPQPDLETRRTTRGGVERQRQTEIERAKVKDSLVKRGGKPANRRAPSPKRALTPVSDDEEEESNRWDTPKPIPQPRRIARVPKRKMSPLEREDSPLTDISVSPPNKTRYSLSASPQAESDCSSAETLVASPPSKDQKLFRISPSPLLDSENGNDPAYQPDEPPTKKARTVRASTRKPKIETAKPRASARPRRIAAGGV